jgi:hypothetical protein
MLIAYGGVSLLCGEALAMGLGGGRGAEPPAARVGTPAGLTGAAPGGA